VNYSEPDYDTTSVWNRVWHFSRPRINLSVTGWVVATYSTCGGIGKGMHIIIIIQTTQKQKKDILISFGNEMHYFVPYSTYDYIHT
jgi:hypothetical protein